MTIRIAINGFGRIGRGVLRAMVERRSDLELVAVNDLTEDHALAQLYNFDSVYGRIAPRLAAEDDELVIDEHRIRVLSERDPEQLPWKELEIDIVLESTGRFASHEAASAHLRAGAGRVLVSAPCAGADVTLVRGVNDDAFDPAKHRVLSSASCTTNALAPLAKVLHELAGIEAGFMTTVHAYTQDQQLLDGPHRDPRRALAAAVNVVPTVTGAARAIGEVLPELSGRLDGGSLRVPVPVGSIVELNARVARAVSVEKLHERYASVAEGELAGILEFSTDPLVSHDIVGNPASSIFDSGLTRVLDTQVQVWSWYDNEWGFSNRVVETMEAIGAA